MDFALQQAFSGHDIPGDMRQTNGMNDADIMAHFESLGDSDEVGTVQRAAGLAPSGIFRCDFVSFSALLRALDNDLAEVASPDRIDLYTGPDDELMVRIDGYGFEYRTGRKRGDTDADALRQQQIGAIKYLADQLVQDLRAGAKIFVRIGPASTNVDDMATLLRAMRRHGPATLLWVTQHDDPQRLGTVEAVAPGLLRGFIDRFAPFSNPRDFSPLWLDICRRAYSLWRAGTVPSGAVSAGGETRGANLIRQAARFGGSGWWAAQGAAARHATDVSPPVADAAVTEHRLVEATTQGTAAIFGCTVTDGPESGALLTASLFVWLPADFAGTTVGLIMNGAPSLHIVNARLTQGECWQRAWVTARLPADAAAVNPSLYVIGPAGTRVFTSCWKLEVGSEPTDFVPDLEAPAAAPDGQPPAASAALLPARPKAPPGGTVYRFATLDALARELPMDSNGRMPVERMPLLPAASYTVPAPAFGATDLSARGVTFHPSGDFAPAQVKAGPAHAYMLRGVTVHGAQGIVSVSGCAIGETLPDLPADMSAGSGGIWLPDLPLSARLPVAYHLMAGHADNYYHWLTDILARFRPAEFERFSRQPEAASAPILLQPPSDTAWKRQSQGLLVPRSVPRISLEPAGRLEVAQLFFVPDLSGGMMSPHPALLDGFDAMRASALVGVPPRAPWRRLYVARTGSTNRVLDNEAEVAARAEAAGFTTVLPAQLPVVEQIRLFAEASHILAPHGAALANIVFCRPGAVLCELHMDAYVHQVYRRLAALRGLRYGCLVGAVVGERHETPAENRWRLDLGELDAVLADPRFMGDGPAATDHVPDGAPDPESRRSWIGALRRLLRLG